MPMSARPWGQQRRLGAEPGSKSQGDSHRVDSIQAYVVRALLAEQNFDVLVDDDRAGEAADLVGLRIDGNDPILTLVHCKFSTSDTPGARVEDPVRRMRSSNAGRPLPRSRGRGRGRSACCARSRRTWLGRDLVPDGAPSSPPTGVGRALTSAALELAADIGADRAFLQVEASKRRRGDALPGSWASGSWTGTTTGNARATVRNCGRWSTGRARRPPASPRADRS